MEEPQGDGMIKKRLFSVVYMFLLTFFFTAVVSGIHEINRERIAINEEIKLQKVILKVLGIQMQPEIPDVQIRQTFGERVKAAEGRGRILYRGFAEDRKTMIGFAFPLFGPGFWGPVYGMMAVDPELKKVIGIAFYQHSETPGLGGRITEAWFENQFKGKLLNPPGEKKRYFSLVPPGTSKAENEVDAITGATGTSRAVERLIDKNLKDYLPWIAEQHTKGTI
jgi:Na+-transporting NADH:ubiquinone oxidoreductase subunit C